MTVRQRSKELSQQYQRAYVKRQLETNPEKYRERKRLNQRRNHLRRTFNLTLDEYTSLLQSQNNLCAVCHSPNSASRDWHVDHNHITGKVRGILCHSCNLMIGHAKDSVDTLSSAIQYLSRN